LDIEVQFVVVTFVFLLGRFPIRRFFRFRVYSTRNFFIFTLISVLFCGFYYIFLNSEKKEKRRKRGKKKEKKRKEKRKRKEENLNLYS